MPQRRALIIGGSLGRAHRGASAAQRRLGRGHIRAQRRGPAQPRRRHRHPSASHRDPATRRHRVRRLHGREGRACALPRPRRKSDPGKGHGAFHERLGAPLPVAARAAAGGVLPARPGARARRAGRRWHHRGVRRWHARGAAIFWSAPTASARPCGAQFLPDLQPLYAGYVAWRAMLEERDNPRKNPRRDFRVLHLLPAGGRAVPRLSGAGTRQRHRGRAARL